MKNVMLSSEVAPLRSKKPVPVVEGPKIVTLAFVIVVPPV